MKKRFLILLLGILCVIVIVSYPHKDSVKQLVETDAAISSVPTDWQQFTQENWSLSFPGDGWEELDNSVPEIKIAAKNTGKECLILFSKQDTTESYAGYVADSLRVFVENGAKIYSASQVVINKNKFVLVQMTRRYEVIWFWLTVRNGFGYNLACASDYEQDAGLETNHDFCESVANTLRIN